MHDVIDPVHYDENDCRSHRKYCDDGNQLYLYDFHFQNNGSVQKSNAHFHGGHQSDDVLH